MITDAATRMPVLELSIGDYVLAGGEVAAMVMIEAITRLIPGVLGNPDSAPEDSFSGELTGLLEAPSYTRPPVYRGIAGAGRADQRRPRRRRGLPQGGIAAPDRDEPARPDRAQHDRLITLVSCSGVRSGTMERLPSAGLGERHRGDHPRALRTDRARHLLILTRTPT